ncbi:MAG: hypothetical protein H7070_15805 [Saprospiraceae bacterium]|nr:hypothetical protein [Pyrinomonadaceae bacterium]
MRKLTIPFFMLVFASFAFGHDVEMPEIGTLADIEGKTKYYISADTEDRRSKKDRQYFGVPYGLGFCKNKSA